jgi:hypothetical protein
MANVFYEAEPRKSRLFKEVRRVGVVFGEHCDDEVWSFDLISTGAACVGNGSLNDPSEPLAWGCSDRLTGRNDRQFFVEKVVEGVFELFYVTACRFEDVFGYVIEDQGIEEVFDSRELMRTMVGVLHGHVNCNFNFASQHILSVRERIASEILITTSVVESPQRGEPAITV